MTLHQNARQWSVERRTLGLWLVILVLESYLLFAYFAFTGAQPTGELRYLIYPFIWVNTGLWAVRRVDPTPSSRAHRIIGLAVAVTYLLVVLYIPGTIGLGVPAAPIDLRVAMYAPGWGPILAFTSPWLRLYLVPFELIGYASLAYLVYANVLQLTRGTFSGVLGLVTCAGCTVPVLTPFVGLLGGPATSLTTTAYTWSYDIGTVFFVLTVGLLTWGQRRDQP